MAEFEYVGSELELFAQAHQWKAYFRSHLRRFIRGDVLEVGAGLGGTTSVFAECDFTTWTCLEPDRTLLNQLRANVTGDLNVVAGLPTVPPSSTAGLPSPDRYRFHVCTLAEKPAEQRFDAIIYIDVLEHIEHDAAEVARAANHLKPGGKLIILSPAYQYLFSPFDARIGHFRRYTKCSLLKLTPPNCKVHKAFYLDSVGALASLANKWFLKASMPTAKQISFWNRVLVRCSKVADPLLFYSAGRSVIVVWEHRSHHAPP